MKKLIKSNKEECFHDMPEGEESGLLFVEKNIFLFGEINPQTTGSFVAAFKEADLKPGIITLYICSSGGWVEGGLCMYDMIQSSRNQVVAIGCGAVYSAAVLPMEAADIRLMHKSSKMLLHDMSITVDEIKFGQIKSMVHQTTEIFDTSCGYIAKRSKNSLKKIQELCSQDTFLNAKECLNLGLIDKVIKDSSNKFSEYGLEKRK